MIALNVTYTRNLQLWSPAITVLKSLSVYGYVLLDSVGNHVDPHKFSNPSTIYKIYACISCDLNFSTSAVYKEEKVDAFLVFIEHYCHLCGILRI